LQKLAGTWDLDIINALKNMELIPEGEREPDVAAKIHEGGLELARKLLASRYPKRVNPPPEWTQPGEDGKYLGDPSNTNGSSIAFLVEDQSRDLAVLFTGDAHAPVLFTSVMELLMQRGKRRLRLDALKLPHHGSQKNISADLLGQLDCDTFLISSDGSAGYDHPDDETIQLILAEAKTQGTRPALHFNYLSHRTKSWALKSNGNGERYEVYFPERGEEEHGLVVTVG
jgi:Predicted hydrolase (metallo-beta-lactamase superfamily)